MKLMTALCVALSLTGCAVYDVPSGTAVGVTTTVVPGVSVYGSYNYGWAPPLHRPPVYVVPRSVYPAPYYRPYNYGYNYNYRPLPPPPRQYYRPAPPPPPLHR
jgi:hypothetical protein